jgi:hypothetical protein
MLKVKRSCISGSDLRGLPAFRHYFTIDKVRLHGASFCMKHLLCPLCAIRRGAKALKAYLDRWEVIQVEKRL